MKRPSRRALLACLALPAIARAQPGVLRIGIADEETGMGFRKADGSFDGMAVAMGEFFAQGLGLRLELRELVAGARIDALADGEVDLLTSVPPLHMQAVRRVMFARPFAVADWVVVLPQGSPIEAVADLDRRRVGLLRGGEALFARRLLGKAQAEIEEFDGWRPVLAAFDAGRVQAAVLALHAAERMPPLRRSLRIAFPLGRGLLAPAVRHGEHRLLHQLDSLVALGFREGIIPSLHRHFLGTPPPRAEARR